MGEAKGVETRELEYISNGYPRDLLQRLSSSNLEQIRMMKTEEPEEIELNLGLSLGGRFGVDPKESNKLVRSTSIAGLATVLKENDSAAPQQVFHPAGLFRTTSLPTETEEEWRKRKEMQCLRRMEAKRKRSEKQQKSNNNNLKAVSRGSVDEDKRIEVGVGGGGGLMACSTAPPLIPCVPKQQSCMVSNGMFSASVSPPPPVGLASWGGRGSKAIAASFPSPVAGIGGQQGSMGSQGSSSTSGISEFDSRPQQGSSNCTEARSPSSVQSVPDQNEKKSSVSPTSTINAETVVPMKVEAAENASKKPKLDNGLRETGMKVMEEMPCVSTKGDGPNGRKIEGFLYKYKKGEEVRIVCVCHGEFLSPAEFVKHAGGGDVAHPLRHIVVNPSPSFL